MSHTPRPKSLAMMFIVGAFVIGGSIGFIAGRGTSSPAAPRPTDERGMRETLAQELSLTPAQRTVVDSAWDWRRERSRAILALVRPALDSVRDSARVLMMNTLDAQQQAAFRALIERNRRAMDSAARARSTNR